MYRHILLYDIGGCVVLYVRNEMVEKRRQVIELQGELSIRAQERLQAKGQAERLGLELQFKKEQLHDPEQEGVYDPNPRSSTGKDNELRQARLLIH